MFAIFALVCARSVRMPADAPLMETARPPSAFTAIATSALAACSPLASKRSSSRGVGCGETSPASLIKLSVTPAIAEMTATTRQPSRCVSKIRCATLQIRVGSPTEVPPYFWTIRRIGRCSGVARIGLISQPTRLPLQIFSFQRWACPKSRCLAKAGAARQTRLCDGVGFLSTVRDCFADCVDRRRHRRSLRKFSGNDLRVLQTVPGAGADNDGVFGYQIVRVAEFEQPGNRSGARWFDKNSFRFCEPRLRFQNFTVGHDLHRTVGFVDCTLGGFPARRISDANGRRDRLRFFDDAAMKHGRGVFRLNSNHPRQNSRFAELSVLRITGGIGREISSIAKRKNVNVRRVAEFIDNLERCGFLSGDSIGID